MRMKHPWRQWLFGYGVTALEASEDHDKPSAADDVAALAVVIVAEAR